MKKTVYIETYGCAANQNNSEILAGLLTQAGHIITNNEELADCIIINSCVVKGSTESKIKRKIQDLKQFTKNKLLIVGGCMPETDAKIIKKLNPNIILLGTHDIRQVINLIGKKQDIISKGSELKLNLPKIPQNKLISIHQISEGCLGACTFCKTKLAKGKLQSYPEKEIVKSIESDLKQGAKEIWITSQDCANYNLDKGKNKLPSLLNQILSLKHKFKIRLGMMDPNNILPILEELIEIYKNPKIYKFVHLPIQSASNKVLKHMNRFYTIQAATKIIEKFRKEIPEIVIATDIIVGYPTETEQDNKETLEFLKKYHPQVLNLSKFTKHKGTAAEKLKELPIKTIKKRTTELMKIHRETAAKDKLQYKGKIIDAFIQRKIGDKLHEARDENYNLILVRCDKSMLGKTLKVKITQTGVHHMIGELI